jgi:heme oxygenase
LPDHVTGLALALREGTRALHGLAERSGIVREIVLGRVYEDAYVLYLRNLLPVYQEMEHILKSQRGLPLISTVARPPIYRAAAIEADLEALRGSAWSSLPVLRSSERYAECIAKSVRNGAARLLAHAYVRYMGDLSGGPVLGRKLSRALGLGPEALHFYTFPEIRDQTGFKVEYRRAICACGEQIADWSPVIDEAMIAFELNIALSESVLEAADSAVSGR